jgi:hypothetical protein
MSPDGRMTARERHDLAMLVRQRERVLKSAAQERSAELVADFERQLGTIYDWDQDEIWAQAHAVAQEMTLKASEAIARRCRELGIPKRFAPDLSLHWYGRGENAVGQRRTELRRMAVTEVKALPQPEQAIGMCDGADIDRADLRERHLRVRFNTKGSNRRSLDLG